MIPDNVEKIIMTRESYDRNIEQLLVEKLELEKRIQKAVSLIEHHTTAFGDLILEKQLNKMLVNILEGDDK